jgi:hypothetical protein
MLPAKGEVAEDESQRAAELVEVSNEERKRSDAIEALEVRVLDEGDEGVRCAPDVIVAVDRVAERWTT